MMKVNYTSGKISAEIEADTQIDLFQKLANFQEIFAENKCAKCGSDNIRFQVRNVEENLYYEAKCSGCGAKLAFGVMKKGGRLFPKRKDKDGGWLPDGGWVKWNPDTQKEE
jgi:DNA-directed RNA polymerase subunit RPC12/RpoP|tara:strand:+ start:3592 stop:3924 length:333 start_codon:yes stop_codon:yes gene_type:complete